MIGLEPQISIVQAKDQVVDLSIQILVTLVIYLIVSLVEDFLPSKEELVQDEGQILSKLLI